MDTMIDTHPTARVPWMSADQSNLTIFTCVGRSGIWKQRKSVMLWV